jgi:hypothetical protein
MGEGQSLASRRRETGVAWTCKRQKEGKKEEVWHDIWKGGEGEDYRKKYKKKGYLSFLSFLLYLLFHFFLLSSFPCAQ